MSLIKTNMVSVLPGFDSSNRMNSMAFKSRDLNVIMEQAYLDDLSFYQRMLGFYHPLKLTHDQKFILHNISGTPWMWQKHIGCTYDPTGSLTMGKRELEPEKIYMYEKNCYDELFDSCFRQLIVWGEDGSVGLDEEGMVLQNKLINEMVRNAQLGLRVLLTTGKLHDIVTPAFRENTPNRIQDLFVRTSASARGWVKLFYDMAAAGIAPWLNIGGIIPEDNTSACGDFSGSVVDIYDELRCRAKPGLVRLINRGGSATSGTVKFRPVFVLSDTLFNQLANELRVQNQQVAQNDPRISVQTFGTGFEAQRVYFIDNTPVMPLSDVNEADTVIDAQTHFAGIIATGNIQLGTSFTGIPYDIEQREIGILIERETSNINGQLGQYAFTSHALVATALADPDYAVASIQLVS